MIKSLLIWTKSDLNGSFILNNDQYRHKLLVCSQFLSILDQITSYGPFESILVQIRNIVWTKTWSSEAFEVQWNEVSYEMPTVNELLNANQMVYCTKEYTTIQHFANNSTWVCTSWGKFYITYNWQEMTFIYQYI